MTPTYSHLVVVVQNAAGFSRWHCLDCPDVSTWGTDLEWTRSIGRLHEYRT